MKTDLHQNNNTLFQSAKNYSQMIQKDVLKHIVKQNSNENMAVMQNKMNIITLKNQTLQPELIKISVNQSLLIKVSHNNSYKYSQISGTKKKYIFAIQQLELQTDPLQEGQQYLFQQNLLNRVGQFPLICINIPKIQSTIIIQKSLSQAQQQSNKQMLQNILNLQINKSQLLLNTPKNKLAQVQEQQMEDNQTIKDNKQVTVCLSNSKSDLEEYQRILTEEEDPYSDSLENKYIKYFKQEFKLWRQFFQQKEEIEKNQQLEEEKEKINQLNEQKKQLLKSKHTKNLSLSQVKEIDPFHKSQYQSQNDSSSQNNSSSIGKNVSIGSQLYSHQQIIDRNNDDDINSQRKQMKKTNSEYGFNIMRSQQQKQPTLDKISIFGKQEEINLPSSSISHSRRSNIQLSSKKVNNNQKNKSRISMSRTQTNSPVLREYKKQNNFLTWATQWAKQKQYKKISVEKKLDHHLIKQMDTFMKNKFKVSEFLYC